MLRSFKGSTGAFSRCNVVNMGTVSATNWTNATREYVDLGLSVKWASCNVGATTPTDYGDYFAWGETTGYSADEQHSFYWDNYSLTSDGGSTFTACTDANNNLLPAYDAATSNWGSAWRMPTKAEQDELRTQCTWTWYGAGNNEYSGVIGYKVTGTNGNSIFLPAAGYCSDTQYIAGVYGAYWSTSLFESELGRAYVIEFASTNVDCNDAGRCIGLTVRPVLAE